MLKYNAVFYANGSESYKIGYKVKFRVNVELNQLTNEIIYALFTVRHTLSFVYSSHKRLGRDHYARCALRPKSPVFVSKERCSNSRGRIHRERTSPVLVPTVGTTSSFKEILAPG